MRNPLALGSVHRVAQNATDELAIGGDNLNLVVMSPCQATLPHARAQSVWARAPRFSVGPTVAVMMTAVCVWVRMRARKPSVMLLPASADAAGGSWRQESSEVGGSEFAFRQAPP